MNIVIEQVENGFILIKNGQRYIAASIGAAAILAGETESYSSTDYRPGYGKGDIIQVREYAKNGSKIEAIKLLRSCFAPTLGLREAKDIVDSLC